MFLPLLYSLSAEEIKEVFEENGFETEVDTLIETSHLYSDKHFSNKFYQNWLFVARKKSGSLSFAPVITTDSVLKLASNVNYQIKGNLDASVEKKSFEIILPSGDIFEGAETAINIIKLVLVKEKTVSEIINELQLSYGKFNESEITYIINVLNILVEKKTLCII